MNEALSLILGGISALVVFSFVRAAVRDTDFWRALRERRRRRLLPAGRFELVRWAAQLNVRVLWWSWIPFYGPRRLRAELLRELQTVHRGRAAGAPRSP